MKKRRKKKIQTHREHHTVRPGDRFTKDRKRRRKCALNGYDRFSIK